MMVGVIAQAAAQGGFDKFINALGSGIALGAIYAETGRQNRIAAEKRFQTMNAALFGRRYY